MTHPLTPREKVALKPCPMCGMTDSTDNATQESGLHIQSFRSPAGGDACRVQCACGVSGPSSREDWQAAEKWNRRTALASGSGDHAELARLADLLDLYAAAREDEFTVEDVQLIDRGSVLISAILAEIAALRAENDVLEVERIGLRSAIFGSHDYDPGLRHGGFIEMARTTEDARRGAVARAIEAERKLAEAEQVIRDIAETPYTGADWPRSRAATYIASKEAERG